MVTSCPEDDLLIHLRLLAKVKPEEKLFFDDEYIGTQAPSRGVCVMRFLRGDNRHKTVDKLKKIVDYCIEFCNGHVEYLMMASMICRGFSSSGTATATITPTTTAAPLDHLDFDLSSKCRERYGRLQTLNHSMRAAIAGMQQLEMTYPQPIASQISVRILKLERQVESNEKHLYKLKALFDVVRPPLVVMASGATSPPADSGSSSAENKRDLQEEEEHTDSW